MTKTKFIGVVKILKKIFPEIEEARCRIKIKNIRGKRNRYEVSVNIITTAEIYSYTGTGWDLPILMDQLSDGLKRKVIREQNKKGNKSQRFRLFQNFLQIHFKRLALLYYQNRFANITYYFPSITK
jgi:ribosome-associated translation inhibitor RaiA